ncbi:MAG: redox-sensing transcriptional repressor Rex [Spirochaetales bacterium]|nr:redox-sensing transcriptional repressor Rex [Spirochaetales bacterium]
MSIPEPTIKRLCKILSTLEILEQEGNSFTSSSKLEQISGFPSHTIRKDFSFLNNPGRTGSGYEISALKGAISQSLGLVGENRACVVGLGRLGSSLLEYPGFNNGNFKIVAGFDRSVNKIEMMDSTVELFPAYKLEEIILQKKIDIGIIAVPADVAVAVAQKMIDAGVRGILNFAPVRVVAPEGVVVQNVYAVDYLRFIASMINQR